MSVLIKGMEMPKAGNWKTIRIYYDGTCVEPNWQGDCRYMRGCEVVPVPPHGDLVERNALLRVIPGEEMVSRFVVSNAPTIIPAEEVDDGAQD